MTWDNNPVFLDTNILVYASTIRSPLHQVALQAIQQFYDAELEIWISRQVLREYLTTLTRHQQFTNPMPIEILIADIRLFQTRFQVAEDTRAVTERLLEMLEKIPIGGRQIHDDNIVATMLVYGVNNLLNHNIIDFQRFSNLINVMPLV